MNKTLKTIGSTDVFNFVDLDKNVAVKIDTGAESNSVHATGIKLINKNGKKILRCRILKEGYLEFEDYDITTVTSSNGVSEQRFKVKLKIKAFNKVYNSAFTLANRKSMKFPVLIGKNFLKNRFIVDVSQKNLSHNYQKSKS